MESKKEIRKRILRLRSELSDIERTQKSSIIQKKVIANKYYQNAESVLLYIDYHDEVETSLLISDCISRGKTVACPRVLADGEMEFFEINGIQDLKEGYKGIREPVSDVIYEPEQALVIVPGVAFDKRGYRIGYGKGFYDRYLKKHPAYRTIALAFSCQMTQEIPAEEHDCCMQQIITEN